MSHGPEYPFARDLFLFGLVSGVMLSALIAVLASAFSNPNEPHDHKD